MKTAGRFKFLVTLMLVAAGCSGATLSVEDVEEMQPETTVPEILANVADDEAVDATAPAGTEEQPVTETGDSSSSQDPLGEGSASDPSSSSVPSPPTTPAGEQSASEQPASSAQQSSTTASTSPVARSDGFLPPGAVLPSDAECEASVTTAAAVRAANATPNATRGGPALSGPEFERVTGNMSGTTDEILQWAACKWGLPADVARAQAATETWWRQGFLGDWTTTAADCAPGHSLGSGDRPGECPQSIGLLQIKYKFFMEAFPGASESTAYSVDYAYAVWRNCYEGRQGWLNDSERGQDYAAGDAWGCIGRWFAGQWYTQPATDYIGHVREALDSKVWTSADFIAEG